MLNDEWKYSTTKKCKNMMLMAGDCRSLEGFGGIRRSLEEYRGDCKSLEEIAGVWRSLEMMNGKIQQPKNIGI